MTKTFFKVVSVLLKVSWAMLLLAAPNRDDAALQEVYLAIALTLYTVLDHCVVQVKLARSIRGLVQFTETNRERWVKLLDFERFRLSEETKEKLLDSMLKDASWTFRKQAFALSGVVLLSLMSVARLIGAIFFCQSGGLFTSGCVKLPSVGA